MHPHIEAYRKSPRRLPIKDRIIPGRRVVDRYEEMRLPWDYDYYEFEVPPEFTEKDLVVHAVADEEFEANPLGGSATVVAGPNGERLPYFFEQRRDGVKICVAGTKLVLIKYGYFGYSIAGLGVASCKERGDKPFVMINDIEVNRWLNIEAERYPSRKDIHIWGFSAITGKGPDHPKYSYRDKGGFYAIFTDGAKVPERLYPFAKAFNAAREKFNCERCRGGDRACPHYVQ